jgi:predicted metal-dependent peptidase
MITIAKALFEATEAYPYFARGFAALIPVKKETLPTLAVDKYWRLYYNDQVLEQFQYNLPAVIRHELEHLIRDHEGRIESRFMKKWNYACDMEINDDIPNLPETVIFPSTYNMQDGLSAEEYYSKLQDDQIGGKGVTIIIHGSGVGNNPGEWEDSPEENKEKIEISISKAEAEQIRDMIAEDIIIYNSKNTGVISSNLLVWATARKQGKLPVISWKSILSRKVSEITNGRQDYTYAKLSRRNQNRKIVIAGKIGYKPTISVIIDTSGSMASEEYGNWIAGCLSDIAKMKARTKLIACDSEVKNINKLRSWRDVLKLAGGGGTDMREGIKKADSDIILVLTDGYTPWPDIWPDNMIAIIKENTTVKVYDKKSCSKITK